MFDTARVLNVDVPVARFSFIALLLNGMLLSGNLFAAAGDTISNTATVNYNFGGTPTVTSASVDFTEDRIINFIVTDDNGGIAVPVISNMIGAVMQFTLTNTGNDIQDFLLTALDSSPNPFSAPPENFDPVLIQVFVESGTTPGYQAVEDTAVFVDELAVGDSVTVYVVSNLPAVVTNQVAAITLIALVAEAGAAGEGAVIDADDNGRISPAGSFGGTATPGGTSTSSADSATTMETVFNDPAGLNPEDIATDIPAVQDVTGNGQHADTGAYQVTPPVIINKAVTVIDTLGGIDPHTGATLRYQLDVTIAGNTAVDELVISDLIPANTTYVNGSILLNGVAQTDADDATDFSQAINILAPPVSSIEVDLGQDAAVSVLPGTTNIIIFDVTIN
jgi:uncharacterized repeat protein (TIGR01451 family)